MAGSDDAALTSMMVAGTTVGSSDVDQLDDDDEDDAVFSPQHNSTARVSRYLLHDFSGTE